MGGLCNFCSYEAVVKRTGVQELCIRIKALWKAIGLTFDRVLRAEPVLQLSQ